MKWTHKELIGLSFEREKVLNHPTVEGLRLRAYPTGRKGWQWARMLNGKPLRKGLGKFPAISVVQAQVLASELNHIFDQGIDPTLPSSTRSSAPHVRVSVEEGWGRYIADCERRGRRSVHKLDLTGRKDIVGVLGMKYLSDIDVNDVHEIVSRPVTRALKNKRATQGGKTRSNAVLRTTRTFLNFCLKNELDKMTRNPALAVDPITNISTKAARTLKLDEMALLLLAGREYDRRAVAEGKTSTWADSLAMLVLNGNRKNELFEAMGEEWDRSAKYWRIDSSRYKTGVNCVLPVGPTTASILDQRARPGEYIIPSQTGVRTGQDRHICDALTQIMEEISGQNIEKWSMHSIRHGFRHNIRKTKIADSELAEMIIHPKRKLDMDKRYDGDWRDEMREALIAWDKRINEEITRIAGARIVAVA